MENYKAVSIFGNEDYCERNTNALIERRDEEIEKRKTYNEQLGCVFTNGKISNTCKKKISITK